MNQHTPTKTCTKCGEAKPKTFEYFPSAGYDRKGQRYLSSVCKACKRQASKRRREADPEAYRAYRRQKYAENPEPHRRRSVEHYHENRQANLVRMREYYAKNASASAKRFKRNYAKNRAQYIASGNAWRRANPEKVAIYRRVSHSKRRAAILASPSHFTVQDLEAQLKQQNGKCYWCGKKLEEYHVDHIFALSRGGTNEASNICCACPECNHSKGPKLPHEWTGRLF